MCRCFRAPGGVVPPPSPAVQRRRSRASKRRPGSLARSSPAVQRHRSPHASRNEWIAVMIDALDVFDDCCQTRRRTQPEPSSIRNSWSSRRALLRNHFKSADRAPPDASDVSLVNCSRYQERSFPPRPATGGGQQRTNGRSRRAAVRRLSGSAARGRAQPRCQSDAGRKEAKPGGGAGGARLDITRCIFFPPTSFRRRPESGDEARLSFCLEARGKKEHGPGGAVGDLLL